MNKLSVKQRQNLTGWAFLTPAVILLIVLNFIPLIQAFFLSLQTGRESTMEFTGFSNYARMFRDPNFIQTVKTTLLYMVVMVLVMIILGIILAVLLNDPLFRLKGIYRTCIFLPAAVSLVASAIIFRSLYEAARIDGATSFQCFRKITLPLLKPMILFTTVMCLNSALQVYDESVNLTGGGPGMTSMALAHYIYNTSFVNVPNFGYSCAMSMGILIFVAVMTFIQMKAGDTRE